MKKNPKTDDIEIFIDPKPLTKEEEIGLSKFIKKHKGSKAKRLLTSKQKTRSKVGYI